MRNEKGVTLLLLVLTLIVLAIIIGTISYSSISRIKMRAYYNMCADIELLDEKIALYYLENKSLPIEEDKQKNITDLIPDYPESNEVNNANYNPNNSGTLYKIDLTKLDNLSLNYTDYYIDEQSHTIYTSHGINLTEDDTYYTVPLDYQEVNLSSYR